MKWPNGHDGMPCVCLMKRPNGQNGAPWGCDAVQAGRRLGIMATINDIAKMAGVSTSTVSHVVNKTRYVSPEKVEKVEKAIRELDNLPNFIVKKTSVQSVQADQRYILMVITDKKSDFQRRIEQQIEERLKKTDYTLITVECGPDISGKRRGSRGTDLPG